MEHSFPCSIREEEDLKQYEAYLNADKGKKPEQGLCMRGMSVCRPEARRECGYEMRIEDGGMTPRRAPELPQLLSSNAFFPGYLRGHIGKLVKVESLLGDRLECRVGTLLHVGADHIVLKLFQSCCTMVCDICSIQYVTVIHDNDRSKTE